MTSRDTRTDRIRGLSALGAGVLLAATPRCGLGSESELDYSNGGTHTRGGASGSAGTGNGGAGYPGYGGYGGNFGPGLPPTTGGGTPPCVSSPVMRRCYTPDELVTCSVADGGVVDGGVDASTGTGEGGEGGEAGAGGASVGGEASDAGRIPIPEGGAVPEGGSPPVYDCPSVEELRQCATNPPVGFFSLVGWNGSACCYTFSYGCY